jgi:hypothetical protein
MESLPGAQLVRAGKVPMNSWLLLAATAVVAVLVTAVLCQFAVKRPAGTPAKRRRVLWRCLCCARIIRGEGGQALASGCDCAWSAVDVLDLEEPTCSVHRRPRPVLVSPRKQPCRHRPVTTSAGPFCELCGEEL